MNQDDSGSLKIHMNIAKIAILLLLVQLAFAEVIELQEVRDINGKELNDALIGKNKRSVIWHKNIGNELVEIDGKLYSLGVFGNAEFIEVSVDWDQIVNLFAKYPGYIYLASQSHNLRVCVGLRNGVMFRSIEPKIDEIHKYVSDSLNKGIYYSTE